MGILRPGDERKPLHIEDEYEVGNQIDYADYIFDDSESDENAVGEELNVIEEERNYSTSHRRKRDLEKGIRYFKKQSLIGSDGDCLFTKKSWCARKRQRAANEKLLMSYTDPQDVCYDCSDLIPDTITAFSRLLSDENKMKIWNEFIEKDEEEQQQILKEIDGARARNKNGDAAKKANDCLRAHHPAYSAESCFTRMDKAFRKSFTKSRNLPLDFIKDTEEQLRNFFDATPSGVYIETLHSKMKRFYFYATAQFLSLTSKSFNGDSPTGKVIQVTNTMDCFTAPSTFLASYISERRKRNKMSLVSC